jgi:hypothetical protein
MRLYSLCGTCLQKSIVYLYCDRFHPYISSVALILSLCSKHSYFAVTDHVASSFHKS